MISVCSFHNFTSCIKEKYFPKDNRYIELYIWTEKIIIDIICSRVFVPCGCGQCCQHSGGKRCLHLQGLKRAEHMSVHVYTDPDPKDPKG